MSILERINKILEEQELIESPVSLETTFDELNIDSLAIVDLTMSCEEEFDIELDIDAENAPKTIGDMVEQIAELTGEEA